MINVLVPATSANLGSGFDSLGIALGYYNYITMSEHNGLEIVAVDGVEIPTDQTNLIYTSAKHLYDLCGKPFAGLKLKQLNNIPMSRGLGSSSACIVGGLVGANHFLGNPLSKKELVEVATKIEGHPDNVAPAILGGLVTAALDGDKVYYVKQNLDEKLNFVAIIPDFELSTALARSVLKQEVTLGDTIFNLSRSALMAVSLGMGKYENLRVASDDRIHQKFRIELIKGGQKAIDIANELGAYTAYISGAGSTLMAIVNENLTDYTANLRKKLDENGFASWQIKSFKADNQGANVVPIL